MWTTSFKKLTKLPFFRPPFRSNSRIKCTVIPGDGVGPELVHSVEEVFKAANVPMDFEHLFLSEINPKMSTSIDKIAQSMQSNKICLKGHLAIPDHSHTGELDSVQMKLYRSLDLYANVVHVKSLPGVRKKHENVDCIVVKEQTEGEYSALEHESVKGMVECLKIVTMEKSRRIAKFAFDYATKYKRKKVTAIHKANIMKLTDGLFIECCQNMASLYPKIKFETMIVDNCSMQLVSKPQSFDVLITTNLYGSIISNIGAGLVGGAGVVPGATYSSKCVMFEQGTRHAFLEGVGKNVANPTAMLLSSVKLLKHVNLPTYGDMIRNSVEKVLREGKVKTKDIGGQNSTTDFTKAIIHNLKPTT